ERRRLQFVRLLMDEPNVLMLDEPTNDLDIETLTSMEDVLDGWAGTLLVVSHDRYLLERMTDRQVALLGDGTLRDLPGGVEQYLRLRRDARDRRAHVGPSSAATAGPEQPAGPGTPTTSTPPSAAQVREARKTLARVERALDRLHEEEALLHDQMVAAATDPARLAELTEAQRVLAEQEEALETEWLEASEVAEG
ncbi:MAG: glycerophosphodiester phosphodiesterase, partial [Acidobacteria bacterium]